MKNETGKHPGGRPSSYSQDVVDTILERIMDGESLRSICNAPEMPAKVTVLKWLRDNEEFATHYTRAKEEQADSLEDDILAVADNPSLDPADKRVRIDARKWIAAKLKPKKYGDKVTQEHTGPNGGAVQNALTVEFVSPDQFAAVARKVVDEV